MAFARLVAPCEACKERGDESEVAFRELISSSFQHVRRHDFCVR